MHVYCQKYKCAYQRYRTRKSPKIGSASFLAINAIPTNPRISNSGISLCVIFMLSRSILNLNRLPPLPSLRSGGKDIKQRFRQQTRWPQKDILLWVLAIVRRSVLFDRVHDHRCSKLPLIPKCSSADQLRHEMCNISARGRASRKNSGYGRWQNFI